MLLLLLMMMMEIKIGYLTWRSDSVIALYWRSYRRTWWYPIFVSIVIIRRSSSIWHEDSVKRSRCPRRSIRIESNQMISNRIESNQIKSNQIKWFEMSWWKNSSAFGRIDIQYIYTSYPIIVIMMPVIAAPPSAGPAGRARACQTVPFRPTESSSNDSLIMNWNIPTNHAKNCFPKLHLPIQLHSTTPDATFTHTSRHHPIVTST